MSILIFSPVQIIMTHPLQPIIIFSPVANFGDQSLVHSWQIITKKGVLEGTKTYPVIRNNSPA
jgi:hypothetical protein